MAHLVHPSPYFTFTTSSLTPMAHRSPDPRPLLPSDPSPAPNPQPLASHPATAPAPPSSALLRPNSHLPDAHHVFRTLLSMRIASDTPDRSPTLAPPSSSPLPAKSPARPSPSHSPPPQPFPSLLQQPSFSRPPAPAPSPPSASPQTSPLLAPALPHHPVLSDLPLDAVLPHPMALDAQSSPYFGPQYPPNHPHLLSHDQTLPPAPTSPRDPRLLAPQQLVSRTARNPAPTHNPTPRIKNDLYKTEICRSFAENDGYCKYGAKCQFAHGEAELRPVRRHPRYKTKLCRNFTATGSCPYDTRCRFIHAATGYVPIADHLQSKNITPFAHPSPSSPPIIPRSQATSAVAAAPAVAAATRFALGAVGPVLVPTADSVGMISAVGNSGGPHMMEEAYASFDLDCCVMGSVISELGIGDRVDGVSNAPNCDERDAIFDPPNAGLTGYISNGLGDSTASLTNLTENADDLAGSLLPYGGSARSTSALGNRSRLPVFRRMASDEDDA